MTSASASVWRRLRGPQPSTSREPSGKTASPWTGPESRSDPYARPDHRQRAHVYALTQLGGGIHDRGGVDAR